MLNGEKSKVLACCITYIIFISPIFWELPKKIDLIEIVKCNFERKKEEIHYYSSLKRLLGTQHLVPLFGHEMSFFTT